MLHQRLPARKHVAGFAAGFVNFSAIARALRRCDRYSSTKSRH
jgi:hypothetical protein